ncbi:hypothetical protein Niako_7174 [Niastella koreensis GR20-10]|uniref:Uncharacterized protein n=2 Tax=Niastella koreensis TaxID=354356 RepID=G8T7U7_NIAKG|nr:hypothetical protein [Niastella koreensis]AEW03391.1 hypothetical protein Niako_7174 [Niastella koreensis GR20-10]
MPFENKPLLCLIVFLLLCSSIVNAQDSLSTTNDSIPAKRRSHLKIELGYLSDNVYMGRSDSAKIPYITAGLRYIHKSGLFAGVSANYLSTEGRADMFELNGGYMMSKGNWDAEISGSKYFYNANSYSVNSETKGEISLYSSYDLGFISPSINAGMKFSQATDYTASLGLEHDFSFLDEKLQIEPGVYMNAATQNYYNAYYQKRKYATTRKGVQKVVGTVTANTENAAAFKVLDYELTVPVEYTFHRFNISVTPVYAIPVNPNHVNITVTTANATRSRTTYESLSNRVFCSVDLTFKI